MAVSTIGNITYINQNMQTTSANLANATQRGDFVPQEFENKLKEIAEVRPTENLQKTDENGKNAKQDEQERKERQEKEANKQEGASSQNQSRKSNALLDITI
ncbi:hypothetical protein [Helicobacter sp. T3_23-1056]